jgi:hypothetical protein
MHVNWLESDVLAGTYRPLLAQNAIKRRIN